jgi:two-component system response regulator YesN
VDDESGQLEILSNIIRELYPHYEVISFDNSIKALDYVGSHPADVVISDIRMPVMDGLELSGQIMKTKPDTILAIISAYSDFEYARRAIDYGVIGYLIKPVSVSKLTGLMDKIEQQIRLKAENRDHIKDLNEQLESYRPVYLEKQLRDWLFGKLDDAQGEWLKSNFKWNGSGLTAVTGIIPKPQTAKAPLPLAEVTAFCKIRLKELFTGDTSVLSLLYDEQNWMLASIIDSQGGIAPEAAASCLLRFIDELESAFPVKARIGLSEAASPITDHLQLCMKQALEALDDTFLISSPGCLCYGSVKRLPSIDDSILYCLENKILDRFRASNLDGIREQLDTFCENYSNGSHVVNSYKLREHFLHIALSAKKHVQHHVKDDIIAVVNTCGSLAELSGVLLNYLAELTVYRQKRDNTATVEIIESIRNYIHDNFKEDISLERIADHFHFNPSYISMLFKTHSEAGFKEYLIRVRIDEAKRLLRETGLKVYEVARRAGYNDVAYFVKLFRKEVGVSPNHYRSRPF